MNRFRPFVRSNPAAKMIEGRIKSFVIDLSWHATHRGLVGVLGDEVVDVATPDADVYHLIKLNVGRGRRFRYVISDGNVYADVHGHIIAGYRTKRRDWCRQEAPWVLVNLERARRLDNHTKTVINAAIAASMDDKADQTADQADVLAEAI